MSVHYLQNYRIAAGFTQEQAAEAIDISVSTLQNWEQGHCPRTPALLHELLDFYNVTPLQRATLILALYMPENIPCIEDIQSISDYASLFTADFSSNRLDPYTDALSVLDARIQWLKCTLKFCKGLLNKQLLSLYNLNTAKSIDKLAKEYNLSICAEYSFQILCVNYSYNFNYPLGEYLAMPDKKLDQIYLDQNTYHPKHKISPNQ